ncbi:MAG TPA: 2-phosphosulfolactate phosphatase [Gemmatimonadales bacterium]|nr:2-phosphosulfolactate phosphatase [Gemmatimonadales bacterium]
MIEVAFTPLTLGPAEVAGRTVFVIDVLRATTTICAALAHGAKAVIPAATREEAVRLAQSMGDDVLLAGERGCVRMPGFALGNSPLEMTREAVQGRPIVQCTTNGTRALLAVQHAGTVYAAGAVNLAIAAERAREAVEAGEPLLIVCAGREGRFSLDDAYAAGRLITAVLGAKPSRRLLDDAALASVALARRFGADWARAFRASASGRALHRRGFDADIEDAARVDAYPVLPHFRDRRLTASALVIA